MNFFKEQELARQRLKVFQACFYLAVLVTAFATAFALFHLPSLSSPSYTPWENKVFYNSRPFWTIFAATALFILGMSWIKRLLLGKGGEYIARMAGATLVPAHSTDVTHRRLRNVVEEMSIASGIIPPKIYIMEQESFINAFAAGFTMHDAVVAVSRGCMEKLTREELQGVVAHEIGHIVNGDMKLNLELIGYLFGLMGVHEIGRFIIRAKGNRRKGNPLVPAGVALFAIGYVGYVVGLILKQSISRGQEYAADARAVQFTRNPHGIGGALKKILAIKEEFKMSAPKAHEMNHLFLFFPEGSDFLATHPPLVQRLVKIFPNFKESHFKVKERAGLKNLLTQDMTELISSSFADETDVVPEVDVPLHNREQKDFDRAIALFEEIANNKPMKSSEFLTEIDLLLGRLRFLTQPKIDSLMKKLKEVVQADGKIVVSELLCYTLFKETLIPTKRRPRSLGLLRTKDSVITILTFLARISSDTVDGRTESLNIGLKALKYSTNVDAQRKLSSTEIVNALEVTRDLVPFAKEELLKACQLVIGHEKSLNFNRELFLKVLSQVMDVPLDND